MNQHPEHIDTLIAKHFAGECTPDEAITVAHWLEENPSNKAYYDQLQHLWLLAPQAKTPRNMGFDTESALAKVKATVAGRTRTRSWKPYLRYAAAATIAMLLFALWQTHSSGDKAAELATLPTEIQTHALPDGSEVTLNRNSGISVQKGFNQKERRIALRGEAYFEVNPDKERPFVVDMAELEVKVLGTAFNVDNNTDKNKVFISVTHGKVAVSAHGNTIFLTANQQAVYDKTTQILTPLLPDQQNPNAIAYKNKVFRFEATPLKEVANALHKAYGVQIVLQNENLEKCPLTASYNNLGLERVLDLIAESFSIKAIRQTDGTYQLSGTGCE